MASAVDIIQDILDVTQLNDQKEGTMQETPVDNDQKEGTVQETPVDNDQKEGTMQEMPVDKEKEMQVEVNVEDREEMHEEKTLNTENGNLNVEHEKTFDVDDKKLNVMCSEGTHVKDLNDEGDTETRDKNVCAELPKNVHMDNLNLNEVVNNELLQKEEEILNMLDLYEYPFKWQPVNTTEKVSRETAIAQIEKKDEEIPLDDKSQWWTKFIYELVLCYEYYKSNKLDKCALKIEDIEKILSYYEENTEPFYNSVKEAVFHIFLASKAFVQFFTNNLDKGILSKIKLIEEMGITSKAAVYGVKSAVFMEFGICGTKQSVDLIKKAIELDPSQGEWHFLLGKALSRIRHVEYRNNIPVQEELKSLETAVNLTKNPSYIIFLAQAYREASYQSYLKSSNVSSKDFSALLDKMTEQSYNYYKMALEERPSCSLINARCAKGFFKLRHPYKDVNLARQCIDKALSLSPQNAMVNHVAGNIYLSQGEVEKAKEFLELASKNGAFGAYMDLLRLKLSEDKEFNPLPDFEEMLARYNDSSQQLEVISQTASYYLFMKNDLRKAAENFMKIMDLDPEASVLLEHRCMFTSMKHVNIYEVLLDEARLLNIKTEDTELREFCSKVIAECLKKVPELEGEEPLPRRQMALDSNIKSKKKDFSKENGQGNRGNWSYRGRGRGRGTNEWRGNNQGYSPGSRGSHGSWKQRDGGNRSDAEGQQRYNYRNGNQGNRFNGNDKRRYNNEGKGRSDSDRDWRSGPRTSESEQDDKNNGASYKRTDSNSSGERVRTESNSSNDGRFDYENWRRNKMKEEVDSDFVKPSDRFQMWRESKQ